MNSLEIAGPGGLAGRLSGGETRPHLSDDGGVIHTITRKEVSHGPKLDHTPRFCARFHRLRNPGTVPPELGCASRRSSPMSPSSRCLRRKGVCCRVRSSHPLCDLLGLLLAAAHRPSLVPGGAEAAVGLDGRARSEARRRRHRSLLQGSGPAAGIGP